MSNIIAVRIGELEYTEKEFVAFFSRELYNEVREKGKIVIGEYAKAVYVGL